MFSALHYAIGLILLCISYLMLEAFMTGNLCSEYYPDTLFNVTGALDVFRFLSNNPRSPGSKGHEAAFAHIQGVFKEAQKNSWAEPNLNSKIDIDSEPRTILNEAGEYVYQNVINNLALTISPEKKQDKEKLLIISHYDTDGNTRGLYESAIGMSVCVEIALDIFNLINGLNCTVTFLFTGASKNGISSPEFINRINHTHIIDIGSIGPRRPFGVITRSKLSSKLLRIISNCKGTIIATFMNDLFKFGNQFLSNGYNGIQLMYFGKTSLHRTEQDSYVDPNDIELLGNILFEMILGFRPEDVANDQDYVAFGIPPLVFGCEKKTLEIIVFTLFIASFVSFYYIISDINSIFKTFIRFIKISSIIAIVFLSFGVFLNAVNTVSYSSGPRIHLFNLIFVGCFIFAYFELKQNKSSSSNEWAFIRMTIDAMSIILTMKFDIVPLFIILFALEIVESFFKYYGVKIGFAFLKIMPIMFVIIPIWETLLQNTSSMPGLVADIVPMIVIIVFVMQINLILVPLCYFEKDYNFSQQDSIRNGFLVYITLILMYFTAKSMPYGEFYVLKGSFSEYIYSNLTSVASFIPSAGHRVLRQANLSLRKNSNIKFDPSFPTLNGTKPAFYRINDNVVLKESMHPWPGISIHADPLSKSAGRCMNVDLSISRKLNHIFESIIFDLKCGNNPCVKSFNETTVTNHIKQPDGNYDFVLRIIPGRSNSFTICINTKNKKQVDIMFITSQPTIQRVKFKELFEKYVQHAQDPYHVSETVLINTTYL